MAKSPVTIRVSDLREDAAAVLARVRKSARPVIITQRGRAAAVMISAAAFARAEAERDMLRQLARGEREIAAGKGYDLDAVLADADALLAEHD